MHPLELAVADSQRLPFGLHRFQPGGIFYELIITCIILLEDYGLVSALHAHKSCTRRSELCCAGPPARAANKHRNHSSQGEVTTLLISLPSEEYFLMHNGAALDDEAFSVACSYWNIVGRSYAAQVALSFMKYLSSTAHFWSPFNHRLSSLTRRSGSGIAESERCLRQSLN